MVVWWCSCVGGGGVGGVVVFLRCGVFVVFLWCFYGGVLVVVFLWWCFVVVFLWRGVFVVVWWCFCGGGVVMFFVVVLVAHIVLTHTVLP